MATNEGFLHVDDSRREAGLDNKLSGKQCAQRGLLSSLQDDDVSGRNGGANLPCPHEHGEVPGDDLAAHADGLVLGEVESSRLGVDDLSVDLVGPSSVVSQAAGGAQNVTTGVCQTLSVVERLDGREHGDVLLKEVGELGQQAAAVGCADLGPGAVESSSGSLDGDVDILLGGLVDGADDLFVGGVDDLEGLALDTLDELVVDEAV